ncbi:5-formyltetrahydrofolate cyclo-ligase [Tenacibaculum haliotis]|uniref:5-formyltetrahydrofolate cyclo-ligase n=1 Tax=Tenacibaculum haliotis TaxID=1888914 RepID=UPI0021B01704|nr:5-formyltetrahydrofolate cyclo-ligase [Tenacibaculum haliotis]MCT4699738.1 5-formyltetrahydrofolate cyclo-ligase [Tenacibaculum haliotis]
MLKADLRKIYKQKRKELTELEKTKFQESIYQQIFDLDFNDINNVHLFLSMQKFNEIDTRPIIDFFRKKDKKIIVSQCNFKDDSLSHFYLKEDSKIALNKFGVPEPINAEEVAVTKIDLVFVPMLISDKKNYRVGYGKGFYDRFLADCRKDTKTIGLNFFPPIQKIEDTHTFDVPLHQIIVPK